MEAEAHLPKDVENPESAENENFNSLDHIFDEFDFDKLAEPLFNDEEKSIKKLSNIFDDIRGSQPTVATTQPQQKFPLNIPPPSSFV